MHAKSQLLSLAFLTATVVTPMIPTIPAHAGGNSDRSAQVSLVATGADADAAGRIKVRVSRHPDDGRLELRLGALDPNAVYEVVVSGIRVGQVTTDEEGHGRSRLRSRPRSSQDGLLGFDPRGAILIVRNEAGEDVLAGDIPTGGNGADDSKIVCCIPDDSGPECEDRTADECVAQGGAVSTATTCMPNPCDTLVVPTEDDVVCCVPDDSGPECEDRSVEECSAEGGIVIAANSCLENPCAAIPSIDDDTRCCEPNDSGPECEDRLPSECLARSGVDIGAGICSVDACAGVPIPTGSESLRIRCEKRSSRSSVSVDGSGMRNGSYTANIVSGPSLATAAATTAVLGEVEFDFDSDSGDIAAGATAIASGFLAGNPPSVTAQIVDADGNVIVEGSAVCTVR